MGAGATGNLGDSIVVPNATVPVVLFDMYSSPGDAAIIAVAPQGQGPAGWADAGPSFYGYLPGAIGNPNWSVTQWSCSTSTLACLGHLGNLVHSHGVPQDAPWTRDGAVAELMSPGPGNYCDPNAGLTGVWRVSDYHNRVTPKNHTYRVIASAGMPGSDFDEFLGCGWG